jgi:hypothetical protein
MAGLANLVAAEVRRLFHSPQHLCLRLADVGQGGVRMSKQTKLTRAARGQECTVQLYPYCNGNPETTVLAHANSEDKGMGIKSPDWWGADACSACHDILDGRVRTDIPREEITAAHIRGIYRTIKRRIEQGVIKV